MPKLRIRVAKIEDIDEKFRDLYSKQDDGSYLLDSDAEDVTSLKSALQKERDEVRARQKALDRYKDVDPEKYAQLLKDHEENERRKAAGEGDWKKLEAQLIEKHQAEQKRRDERIAFLEGERTRLLLDGEATRAIAAADGFTELLMPHVVKQLRVVEKDGKSFLEVVDAAGTARIADAKGTPMTVEQLVANMKTDKTFGRLFKGANASGSGTGSGDDGGRDGQQIVLSRTDAANPQKYRAAKERAAKEGKELLIETPPGVAASTT
jgi:hypothetical protein